MNDSETMMTRAVSLASSLMTLRDSLSSTSSGSWLANPENAWHLDVIYALVFIAMVASEAKLFGGLGEGESVRGAKRRCALKPL